MSQRMPRYLGRPESGLGRAALRTLSRWATDDSGATAIEYALIGMFLSMAIIASIPLLQNGLSAAFVGVVALFPSF